MSYSPVELREMTEHLLDVGRLLGAEKEGMTIDEDFDLEEIVQLRSNLSETRRAIDLVNKALAVYWHEEFGSEPFDDEYDTWYVAQRKGKRIVDMDTFFAWLATKDADELSKLVSAGSVKVSGMSPAERDTMLDESPTNDTLAIQSKPRR